MENGLSNKISNVIGVAIPENLRKQIKVRVDNTTSDSRSPEQINFIANKSAWVRLVSSIDITSSTDLQYFKSEFNGNIDINSPNSLAKEFILFGGTSKYTNNKYKLRAGLGVDGAYGTLGSSEIQQYGYKPMPGITSAKIQTQGRLGSVRSATIEFKVSDKAQLDIIDALYFKLGYTMFLEWGHTVYFGNDGKLKNSEIDQLSIFDAGLKKESIFRQVSRKIESSNGNYDAMFGICTNFNFSMNPDGGFDCTVKLISLGALADNIKINQPDRLPSILNSEINALIDKYRKILEAQARAADNADKNKSSSQIVEIPKPAQSIDDFIVEHDYKVPYGSSYQEDYKNAIADVRNKKSFLPSLETEINTRGTVITKNNVYFRPPGIAIPYEDNYKFTNLYTDIRISLAILPTIADQIASGFTEFLNSAKSTFDGIHSKPNEKTTASYLSDPAGQNKYLKAVKEKTLTSTKYLDGISITNLADRFIVGSLTNITGKIQIAGSYISKKNKITYPYLITFEDNLQDFEAASPGNRHDYILLGLIKTLNDSKSTQINSSLKLITEFFKNTPLFNNEDTRLGDKFAPPKTQELKSVAIEFDFPITVTYPTTVTTKDDLQSTTQSNIQNKSIEKSIKITTWDPSILFSATPKTSASNFAENEAFQKRANELATAPGLAEADKIAAQAAADKAAEEKKKIDETVADEAIKYQSGLEVMLRAIQLHTINRAPTDNLNTVYRLQLLNDSVFTKNLFTDGIFSKIVESLINKSSDLDKYKKYDSNWESNPSELFKFFATYGFSHNVMSSPDAPPAGTSPVNYTDLIQAYLIPYKTENSIAKNIDIYFPVYIPFGFLLMMLNHMCTIYDTTPSIQDPKSKTAPPTPEQTPFVYIDFNPETNFCLSDPLQMSTDANKFIIPCIASNSEYKTLFQDIESNGSIAIEGADTVNIFKPKEEDFLSGQLPEFNKNDNPYRGRLMNVLVNIDYLLALCKNFADNSENQSVNLNPFIQQIITDMNKSLGDINIFRLAYDEKSNCIFISDDQMQPLDNDQQYIKVDTSSKITSELPLFGKNSIAKSLDIKTEISNKLSNMIAISANSDGNKSTAGQDGTPFGHFNASYRDRYKPQIDSIKGKKAPVVNSIEKTAAKMFDNVVRNNYNALDITKENISQATNYYINKMNNRKGENPGTKASAMIPVSVNFSTDGLSGLAMGHAFTIPDTLLPRVYQMIDDDKGKIGFVVVGLDHSLQSNQWTTEVRANMMYLKEKSQFNPIPGSSKDVFTKGDFPISYTNNGVSSGDSVKGFTQKSVKGFNKNSIAIATKYLISNGYSEVAASAVVGSLLQESTLSPTIINYDSHKPYNDSYQTYAAGIAQWVGPRRVNLLKFAKAEGIPIQNFAEAVRIRDNSTKTPNSNTILTTAFATLTLEVELKFLVHEMQTYRNFTNFKNTTDIAFAIRWMYETYEGGNYKPGADIGNRGPYAASILNDITSGKI